jgi:hypothetical protein
MKNLIALVLIFLSNYLLAQEKEIENFKKEITFYHNYSMGKLDSLKVSIENSKKFEKKVIDSFKAVVLHKETHQYDKFIVDRSNINNKFLNLNGSSEITINRFVIDNRIFDVYSFTSFLMKKYYIKDHEKNLIVFEGFDNICYIDNICKIDDEHFLLIEKNSEYNTSRRVSVLNTSKKTWKQIDAFKGKSLSREDNNLEKRKYFQLWCEIDYTYTAPKDVNKIHFDFANKTIWYKQYSEDKKFKKIEAKWENKTFLIDDYNVSENLYYYPVPAPAY